MFYKDPQNNIHALDSAEFESLLPAGCVQITDEDAASIQLSAKTPTPAQLIEYFTAEIQARLDAFARTRKYDSLLSLASYATDPNPKFAAEGQYGVDVRSATWAKSYEIQAAVAAGERPMPTLEQIMSELPVLEWPQ